MFVCLTFLLWVEPEFLQNFRTFFLKLTIQSSGPVDGLQIHILFLYDILIIKEISAYSPHLKSLTGKPSARLDKLLNLQTDNTWMTGLVN